MHAHASPRRGMTLVELLVVVMILLLLAVTTIPRLMPTDVQRGRDAALSVTAMASRVLRRAEQNFLASNGARSAGLWLQPLDPVDTDQPNELLKGTGRSKGVADLFVCEPQDPYRGDDPENALAYVHHAFGSGSPQALLLFSTLTSPNVREFCRSSSRITFGEDPRGYYLRMLSDAEQTEWASNNVARLPYPYRPTDKQHPKQIGFYNTKSLIGAGETYRPFDGSGTVVKGDALLALIQAMPPHTLPPPQSPDFRPGQPPQALYTSANPCNADSVTEPSGGACGCIEPKIERDEFGNPILDANNQPIPVFENGRRVCVPQSLVMPSYFPAADVGTSFTIQRPITRSAAAPISLSDGFGIDLAWSSFGDRLLAQPAALVDATGTPLAGVGTMIGVDGLLSHHPVMVMLSDKGGVQSLSFHRRQTIGGFVSIVEDRIDDPVDVYLLVGRLDRAGRLYTPFPSEQNPGANWQYPDSRWIRISRVNGEFLISEPLPGAVDVRTSQQYARLGISTTRN